jgi:hypothetical protein
MGSVGDSTRPVRNVTIGIGAFLGVADAQFVLRAEVMVDLDVDLLTIGIEIVSCRDGRALIALPSECPTESRAVQAVAGCEDVCLGHRIQDLPDVSGRVGKPDVEGPRIGRWQETPRPGFRTAIGAREWGAIEFDGAKDAEAGQLARVRA